MPGNNFVVKKGQRVTVSNRENMHCSQTSQGNGEFLQFEYKGTQEGR